MRNLYFSLFGEQTIQSQPNKPQELCWVTGVDFRNLSLSTTLLVKEGQVAVLFLDQKISAIVESGTFPLRWIFEESVDLSTLTVYFFNTKTFSDQRWGTASPILFQDAKNGTISLRAHGTFSYAIENPKKLWRHIPDNAQRYSTENMIDDLRSIILNQFTVILNNKENQIQILMSDRAQLAQILMDNLSKAFKDFGLSLSSFLIQSISLPDSLMQTNDNFSKLEKLKALYQEGIITEEEYQAKKKTILKDI